MSHADPWRGQTCDQDVLALDATDVTGRMFVYRCPACGYVVPSALAPANGLQSHRAIVTHARAAWNGSPGTRSHRRETPGQLSLPGVPPLSTREDTGPGS